MLTDSPVEPVVMQTLSWNGNELVFDDAPNVGIAGIAPGMPDTLGEEIARRWNMVNRLPWCSCKACRESFAAEGTVHFSDCAVHGEPAEPNGECDCARCAVA